MDALGDDATHTRAVAQSSTSPLGKGPLKKDYAIGLLFLLAVVLLWTASNFVTQNLFRSGYEKPFLVTYLNTSAFTIYLIPFCVRQLWRGERMSLSSSEGLSGRVEEYQPLVASETIDEADVGVPPRLFNTPLLQAATLEVEDRQKLPLDVYQTAKLAFLFCLLWFTANWSVNASLDYTTVASATILSSTSGFFTLGIGTIFRVERLTVMKIVAVFTCFTGVLLVSLSDSAHSRDPIPSRDTDGTRSITVFEHVSQPILGDTLALISALFYALYVILLKVRIKNESRIDMQLFFGFVGLFNTLGCWPLGFLLHWSGVEVFEPPTKAVEWYAIVINMAITWSSDYLYVLAMLRTTPLVVTIGISLTIPVAVLGDFMLNVPLHMQVMVGAALVSIGFITIGTDKSSIEEVDTVRD
ncbi:hypothetical protein Ac2012v2_000582 [Leucoagaricus gongylophorus]